jgi:hypothetical protein
MESSSGASLANPCDTYAAGKSTQSADCGSLFPCLGHSTWIKSVHPEASIEKTFTMTRIAHSSRAITTELLSFARWGRKIGAKRFLFGHA